MVNSLRFNSVTLMLNEEEKGFGTGKSPAGYIRLELRNGKGKLFAMVQNLKDSDEYSCYKLYLIKYDENKIYPAYMGTIPVKKGRGEFTSEFDPFNMGNLQLKISDFNVGAIIFENKRDGRVNIKCPLAVYVSRDREVNRIKKIKWSEVFSEVFSNEITSNYGRRNSDEDLVHKPIHKYDNLKHDDTKTVSPDETRYEKSVDNPGNGDNEYNEANNMDMTDNSSGNGADNRDNNTVNPVNPDTGANINSDANAETSASEGNANSPFTSDNEETVRVERAENAPVDIKHLVNCLDKVFKRCDPFNTRRNDYRWWKVTNPVYLSNILNYCNIKMPPLFNSSIIMLYYKYRYLIIGIYTNKKKQKEYIVYGIPGTCNVDENPMEGLYKWVQVEGNIPRHGAFGYWVAYINPNTGEFLKLSG